MAPDPDGGGPGHPAPVPEGVVDRWETVLDEAAATAAQYRADGWETLELHPGDVTPLSGDPYGLDVVLPGSEYEALTEAVTEATVDAFQVYRETEGGTIFYVIVFEATDDELAIVCPAFLGATAARQLERRAHETGVFPVHARPLSDDSRVTFTSENPDLFF